MDLSSINKLVEEGVIQESPDLDIVQSKLKKLIDSGFVKQESSNEYIFKDHVTWEIVYETLLYAERRYLHDLIAAHIEENNKNNHKLYAAKLTYHYEKAENNKKVVFYSALAGDRAYELFAIDDAVDFYNKSFSQLNKIKRAPSNDKCALLEKKADLMEAVSDFPKAIELYHESLNILNNETPSSRRTLLPWKVESKKKKSQLLHKKAVAYERSLDFESALSCLDDAEKYLPARPGELPVKINATRGVVYCREMKFDNSFKYAKKSLSIAKKMNLIADIAYGYNIIANIYMGTGKYSEAITSLKNALSHYKEINDLSGMSKTYYNLGIAYVNLFNINESNKYYIKALDIHKKMQDKLSIMYVYFMLAGNKIHEMKFDSAIEDYNHVIKMYHDGVERDDLFGVSLAKLAEIYIEIDELEKAEKYINSSIDILSQLDQAPDRLLQAQLTLAQLKVKQTKYIEAEKIYLDAINLLSGSGTTGLEVFVRRMLGILYRDMTKYDKARDVLNEVYIKAGEIGVEYEQYCIQNVLYDIDVKDGSHDESLKDKVKELLVKFKEKGDLREELLAKKILSSIERKNK